MKYKYTPIAGYIGAQVTFFGINNELDSWDYSIKFSGNFIIFKADSARGDTVFLRVPVGAVTGPVQ